MECKMYSSNELYSVSFVCKDQVAWTKYQEDIQLICDNAIKSYYQHVYMYKNRTLVIENGTKSLFEKEILSETHLQSNSNVTIKKEIYHDLDPELFIVQQYYENECDRTIYEYTQSFITQTKTLVLFIYDIDLIRSKSEFKIVIKSSSSDDLNTMIDILEIQNYSLDKHTRMI